MRGLLLVLGLLCGMAARAAGLVPWVADGAVFRADFNQPTAVLADTQGRMLVLDGTQNRVARLSADGKIMGSFGAEILNLPLDMTLADEGLLVADTGNKRLVLFKPDGGLVKALNLPAAICAKKPEKGQAPKPAPGEVECPDGVAQVQPEPVAVTVLDGIAFWADRKTHRVCRLRLDSGQPLDCFGGRGETAGRFQYPYQIVIDRDDYLNVLDIANARVQVFDKTGRQFSQVGRFGLSPGELYRPNGLAIDSKTDTLFVADSYFGTVSVFRKGEFVGMLQGADGQPVKLDSPTGLSFRDGRLYVAETGANQVRRYAVEFREAPPAPQAGLKPLEISQKNCVLCHLSWATEAPAELRAPDGEGALPEASFKMCYSCHNGAIMDSRLAIHHGAQHPATYESPEEKKRHADAPKPRKDKLPEPFPVTPDKQLRCTTCHTPHSNLEKPDTLYQDHGNAWLRVPNKGGDLCERCHESKGKGARETETAKHGFNHPLAIKFEHPPHKDAKGYPTNAELHKGLPLKLAAGGSALGHDNEMICQTCHQAHGGHDDGKLTVLDRKQGELCAACHPRQFSEDKDDAHDKGVHPINIKRKSDDPNIKPVLWKGKPEITEVGCQTCHAVHKGTAETTLMPEGVKSDGELCKNCHERQHTDSKEEAHRKGVHPVNIKRESDDPWEKPVLWKGKPDIKEVTCQTCHNVHSGNPDTALLPKGIEEAEALCKNCHERQHAEGKDAAIKKGVHPVNAKLDDPVKINDKQVEKVGCLTCHAVHKGKPDTAVLVESDKNGELCSHCHKRKQTVVGTDHDLRITAKDKKNAHGDLPTESGVCGACHTLHRGKGELPFLAGAKRVQAKPSTDPADKVDESPFKRDALCLNCHQKGGVGEDKAMRHFSHPHEDLVLRSDKKVMPLLGKDEKPEEFGRIACVTCHEPHVWDVEKAPPEDAVKIKLSANKDNLEGTQRDAFLRHKGVDGTFCIDCHGLEGIVKYKYFHDKKRSRNKNLDYLK
ncbi:cytochrome c3 family protein [Methylomagnum sp.]